MATSFTNTPIDHTGDAGFRAWGSELSGQLGSVGTTSGCLTQTADTGQINWVTVTRPGTLTAGGYEIWQLTDSLGVSSPVYLKVEYGTGSVATAPAVWVTVGSGTNGAGTLTGSVSSRYICFRNTAPASTVLSYPNYVCAEEGFVGAAGKLGFTGVGHFMFFAVCRFCDPDGTLRSDGIQFYHWDQSNGLYAESLNLGTGVKYGTSTNKAFCMVPNDIASTAVGSDINAFKHYGAYPAVHSLNGVCTVLCNEMGLGTTDTATLNGATSHTYVQLGSDLAPTNVVTANVLADVAPGRRGLCMLWE